MGSVPAGPARSDEIEAILDHGSVGILGSDEFLDATIHRLGEHVPAGTPIRATKLDTEALLAAVEEIFDVGRNGLCSTLKSARIVEAKEALIVYGRCLGETIADLARLTGLNSSTVSRRYASAIIKTVRDETRKTQSDDLIEAYLTKRISNIARLTPDSQGQLNRRRSIFSANRKNAGTTPSLGEPRICYFSMAFSLHKGWRKRSRNHEDIHPRFF